MQRSVLAATLAASALAAGCTGGGDNSVTPVDTTSCADVFYEGEGEPDAIIVSDVSLGYPPPPIRAAMVRVIKGVLRQQGFRAGTYRVGYQSCGGDSSDEGACERRARSYAAAKDVLGVIGPYYSSCAAAQIPILSRRAAGPLAMVSPTNTDPGLTRKTPYSEHDPGALYPDGVRNYVRVVPPDNVMGAAAATLAKQRGAERVVAFVNRATQRGYRWYGPAVGSGFVETARSLGLVTTELEWRDQESYTAIAKRAAAARPQLVFFAGIPQNNARRLLEDVRRQVGRDVVFAAGDQFLFAAEEFGPVGEGLRATSPGLVLESLAPAGRRFLRSVRVSPELAFNSGFAGPAEAAPATEVLLDAIARSNGTRASVVEELFETRLKGGTLGSFSFDRRGDITPARIALFTIRNGAVVVDGVVRVPGRPDD